MALQRHGRRVWRRVIKHFEDLFSILPMNRYRLHRVSLDVDIETGPFAHCFVNESDCICADPDCRGPIDLQEFRQRHPYF